ncbi:hypothetical protein BOTNAR_0238g00130 [Botryotinia narcissicola]|uniref:Uncharacterized protein n=1 Tax=Botryotinia narcissicola TaxID=278944 RepID=A0A4Z1I366_9HELO|nr:hypothetical protein BOTNAR_0238g00130 [Botryotinia narcissicola]
MLVLSSGPSQSSPARTSMVAWSVESATPLSFGGRGFRTEHQVGMIASCTSENTRCSVIPVSITLFRAAKSSAASESIPMAQSTASATRALRTREISVAAPRTPPVRGVSIRRAKATVVVRVFVSAEGEMPWVFNAHEGAPSGHCIVAPSETT